MLTDPVLSDTGIYGECYILKNGGMQRWQSCFDFGISPETSEILSAAME